MNKLCFLQEDTSGRGQYVKIVFDHQKGRINASSEKFYCQDFSPYGLQTEVKIEEADKESSFKKLERVLNEKAMELGVKHVLICIDKSKYRMSWMLKARYQFLIVKN